MNPGLLFRRYSSIRTARSVTSCEFSTDGSRIVSCSEDGTVKVWEGDLGGPENASTTTQEMNVSACAIAPDGRRFVTGSQSRIKTWDTATGDLLESVEGLPDSINSLSYSPDAQRLAVVLGQYSGNLEVWDAATLEVKCAMKEYVEITQVDPVGWFHRMVGLWQERE